jgi:hypothetical protein
VTDRQLLVPVYVPTESVAEFYELAVERIRALREVGLAAVGDAPAGMVAEDDAPSGGVAPRPAATSSPGGRYLRGRPADDTWPDELERRAYDESPRTMMTLFDHMASAPPGAKATTGDFAEALGYTGPNAALRVAGVLGAFTRRMQSRYGREFWPFAWEKDDDEAFHYWMPPHVAARFRDYGGSAS